MQNITELEKRKAQLEFDIDAMRGYIERVDYDSNLKRLWFEDLKELESVNALLETLKKQTLREELCREKDDLMARITLYQEHIVLCRNQIAEIDERLSKMGPGEPLA